MRNPVPQAYRLPAILLAYSTLLLGGVAYRLFWFSQAQPMAGTRVSLHLRNCPYPSWRISFSEQSLFWSGLFSFRNL